MVKTHGFPVNFPLNQSSERLNIQAAIEQFLVHHFGGWRRALMLVRAAAGQIANVDVAINTLLSKPIFSMMR